jgi:hypothetical protein
MNADERPKQGAARHSVSAKIRQRSFRFVPPLAFKSLCILTIEAQIFLTEKLTVMF